VTAFPSLRIQVLDPDLGSYRFLQTSAVPLHTHPSDGRQYFDVRSIDKKATLTDQPAGIWHNREPNPMEETLNTTIGFLAKNFWWLLLTGPLLFCTLLPWVLERRKRSVDVTYRACADAYHALRKMPDGTTEKWHAFRNFLATSFCVPPDAWTSGDAEKCLRSLELSEQEIQQILEIHASNDAADFSANKSTPDVPNLNSLSRRLFDRLRRATPILVVALALQPADVRASDWSDAQSLFRTAIESPSGLPETESLFRQAALKFEAAARQQDRVGESWCSAGNAWFESGELGRAIGCYRQAQIYLPFDETVKENLRAVRAVTVDVVDQRSSIDLASLPIRWICAAITVPWLLFWGGLLIHLRYRTRISFSVLVASLVATLALFCVGFVASHHADKSGVVIVSEIYARKGPAFSYSPAFVEPLHDGLEFQIVDQQSDWLLISLADGRQCWIPASEAQVIHNSR
jgi:hypothetical protein